MTEFQENARIDGRTEGRTKGRMEGWKDRQTLFYTTLPTIDRVPTNCIKL